MNTLISCSRILAVLIVSVLIASPLLAEDQERGRRSDGRAFRTDQDGTQVVDYIAELEVTVDTLTRRLHGLEDSMQEKEQMIERLQKGFRSARRSDGLQERDLVSQQERGDPFLPGRAGRRVLRRQYQGARMGGVRHNAARQPAEPPYA